MDGGIKDDNKEMMPFLKNMKFLYQPYVNPIKKYMKGRLESVKLFTTTIETTKIESGSVVMDGIFGSYHPR